MLKIFALLLGAVVLAIFGPHVWIMTAPASAFQASDFARPAILQQHDQQRFIRTCERSKPRKISQTRHVFVCGCLLQKLSPRLNRVELLMVEHGFSASQRRALSVLKGLQNAGFSDERINAEALRTKSIFDDESGPCLQSSLSDADLKRIGRYLEQLGLGPETTINVF